MKKQERFSIFFVIKIILLVTATSVHAENANDLKLTAPQIPEFNGVCPSIENGYVDFSAYGITSRVRVLKKVQNEEKISHSTRDRALIIYWHGTGETGDYILDQSPTEKSKPVSIRNGIHLGAFSDETARKITEAGHIIFAPNNVPVIGKMTGAHLGGVWREGHLVLADIMVACAVRANLIDPERIYVTGLSAGGLMTSHMTWSRAQYVAATGVFSGGFISDPTGLFYRMPPKPRLPYPIHSAMFYGGPQDIEIINFKKTTDTYISRSLGLPGVRVLCDHNGGHRQFDQEERLGDRSWQFFQDIKFGQEKNVEDVLEILPRYCSY